VSISVAIAGVGIASRMSHIPGLTRHPEARIVAVCRSQQEKLDRICTELECRGYTSFADLLKAERPLGLQAVIVASPHAQHFIQAQAALKAGCHVLVEKPMTLHQAEAIQLTKQAKASGLIIGSVFKRRLQPRLIRLKAEIAKRSYGRIHHIEASVPAALLWAYQGMRPAGHIQRIFGESYRSFRVDDLLAGAGILADVGMHYIDAILWLSGLCPLSVFAVGTHITPKREIGAIVNIQLSEGTLASLHIYGGAHTYPTLCEPRMHLYMDEATIAIDPNTVRIIRDEGVEEWSDGDFEITPAENFIDAILGRAPIACPGTEAIAGVAVLESAYVSMRSSRAAGVRLCLP